MWILFVYVIGIAIGLVAIDGGPGTRLALAIAWPLGPLAFLVTVAGLLVVAAIAFPLFGALLAGSIGAAWWALR